MDYYIISTCLCNIALRSLKVFYFFFEYMFSYIEYNDKYKKKIYMKKTLSFNPKPRYNIKTSIKDVIEDKKFYPYSKYMFYRWGKDTYDNYINDINKMTLDGINRLYNLVKEHKTNIYFIDKDNVDVNLIHLFHNSNRKVAIVLAGGTLDSVCTAMESLPIGERLYDLGFDVFLLTYRVQDSNNLGNYNIDLANAIRYLLDNKDKLNIDMDDYIVIGSSAGGYIVGELGTSNHGYIEYNLPKPGLLVLQYPLISLRKDDLSEFCYNTAYKGIKEVSSRLEEEYSVDANIDDTYPKCFIIRASDDDIVKQCHCDKLIKAFNKYNINYKFIEINGHGHGWGLGTNTPFDGWVDVMVNFYNER